MRPKAPSNPPEDYDDQFQTPATTRRYSLVLSRYDSLKEQFDADREEEYRVQRQRLTSRLDSVIAAKDEAFLELVHDLEEGRDLELLSLKLYEEFLMSRAKKDHDERMKYIEDQFQNSTKEVHDKLTQKLTTQADMLRTGQANNNFLDISSNALDNKITSRSSGLRTSKHTGGYTSNNEATNGTITGGGGSSRSRFRRRDAADTDQGETTDNGPLIGTGNQSQTGGVTTEHLKFFFSDIDFDGHSSGYASAAAASGGPITSGSSNSRSSKQTPKIPSLKQEEIDSDLQLLRKERAQTETTRRRRIDH